MSFRYLRLTLLIVFILALSIAQAQPWLEVKPSDTDDMSFDELRASFNKYWDGRPYEKGKGFKQFKRIEHFIETRMDANGRFNPYAILNAMREHDELFGLDEIDEADWTPLGPFTPVPTSYVGGMGRVGSFAFHPDNENIFYCGSGSGGLWKTVDGGATWAPLTDNLMALGITSVVLNPQDPDVIYIATGDRDASRRRTNTYSIGVWKSLDGGETWNPTGLELPLENMEIICRLAMHPFNPDILIAGTLGGIYRTENGGDTWTEVMDTGDWYDINVDPFDGDTWFATAAGDGVYRSTDGGINWTQLTNGLPGGNDFNRIELEIAPSNTDIVYAMYADDLAPFYTGFYGFYKSEDGGDSWALQSDSPNIFGWELDGGDTGGQGWFALGLAVNPTNADEIHMGSVNTWMSNDGGETWEITGYWTQSTNVPYIHADHHVMQYRDETLFCGNDGGVYYRNPNGSWTDISNMLVISQVYRLGCFQGGITATDMIMNGNQDNGSKLYNGEDWFPVLGGDGFACGVDPVDANYVYGSIYYGDLRRSEDGGNHWTSGNNGCFDAGQGYWCAPLVIYNEPGVLFRANRAIWRSDDHAESWYSIGQNLTAEVMHTLAVAPSDDNYIYASDFLDMFYFSTNGGEDWNILDTPAQKITYLAVDPSNPARVYATAGLFNEGEKVFVSDMSGLIWNNISAGLPNVPVNTIIVHPDNPDHLYIGTDLGVYFSPDAGSTWEEYNSGLPNVIIMELELHQSSNTLLAATWGRGDWQSPANNPDAIETQINTELPEQFGINKVYPNPFNSRANIVISLPEKAELEVTVYNIRGEKVAVLAKGAFNAGNRTFTFNGEDFASGVYFVRAVVNGKMNFEQKFTLVR